jgi:hypothetical protein
VGGGKELNDIHKVNFFPLCLSADGTVDARASLALHLNVIYIQHIPAYSAPSMRYQT